MVELSVGRRGMSYGHFCAVFCEEVSLEEGFIFLEDNSVGRRSPSPPLGAQ